MFLCSVLTFLAAVTGCRTITEPVSKKVQLPAFTPFDKPQIDCFLDPSVRFVPKSGTPASITQDGVTVEVKGIYDLTKSDNSEFSRSFKLPDGSDCEVTLLPRMVCLTINNGTSHIIPIGRTSMLSGTVISLEDSNGKPYPIISSKEEVRKNALEVLGLSFEFFNANLDLQYEEYNRKVASECESAYSDFLSYMQGDYSKQYGAARKQVKKFSWWELLELPTLGILDPPYCRFPEDSWSREQVMLGYLDGSYSPSFIMNFQKKMLDDKRNEILAESGKSFENYKTYVQRLRENANAAINSIEWPSNIILDGDYPPIHILPGRSQDVLIPFKKPAPKDEIVEMNIYVVDLPTVIDAAGLPQKRDTFRFTVVPEVVK